MSHVVPIGRGRLTRRGLILTKHSRQTCKEPIGTAGFLRTLLYTTEMQDAGDHETRG